MWKKWTAEDTGSILDGDIITIGGLIVSLDASLTSTKIIPSVALSSFHLA